MYSRAIWDIIALAIKNMAQCNYFPNCIRIHVITYTNSLAYFYVYSAYLSHDTLKETSLVINKLQHNSISASPMDALMARYCTSMTLTRIVQSCEQHADYLRARKGLN